MIPKLTSPTSTASARCLLDSGWLGRCVLYSMFIGLITTRSKRACTSPSIARGPGANAAARRRTSAAGGRGASVAPSAGASSASLTSRADW
jgi:hypothetical protein